MSRNPTSSFRTDELVAEPLVTVEILPPPGLTAPGRDKTLRETTKNAIFQVLQQEAESRAAQLRAAILSTYTKRPTGQTANSVAVQGPAMTSRGIEVSITVASRALRFITAWMGGVVMGPKPVIQAQLRRGEGGRFSGGRGNLRFVGRDGETVVRKKVHHPGFTSDPILENMTAFQQQVHLAVMDTVARSSAEWVDGLGTPVLKRGVQRQYRKPK